MRSVVGFQPQHIVTVTPLYVVQDAELSHQSWPDTFPIPTQAVRRHLHMHQQAQLGFYQERADEVFIASACGSRSNTLSLRAQQR
jgi:hypothetical protein